MPSTNGEARISRRFPFRPVVALVVVLAVVCGLSSQTMAVSVYWTGTNSNLWSDSGNWSGGTPGASNDVYFVNTSGTVNNYTTVSVTASSSAKNLYFNSSAPGPITLTGSQIAVSSTIGDSCTTSLMTIENSLKLNTGGVSNGYFDRATGAQLKITGNIIDGNTITVSGDGLLWLTGTVTTGNWGVSGGILRTAGTAPSQGLSASKLTLSGGAVLESQGTYTRTLNGSSGISLSTGGGGFSAYDGYFTVDLNTGGTRDALAWSTFGNYVLTFGSVYSNNIVELYDNLDLKSNSTPVTRQISVIDNPNSLADRTKITGALSTSNTTGLGNLEKIGDGILELAGANTYNGATTVTAGTLLVTGSLDSRTSAVTVASAAKLGGTGTINRPVVMNGTLTPGMSVGKLTTGDLTVNAGSILEWQLGTSLTDYDCVTVNGSLTLPSAAITLKLYNLDGVNPAGHSFDIITWTSATDPANLNVTIDYGTTGWSGASVSLSDNAVVLAFANADPIPEPATMVLMLLGGFLGIRRLRRPAK